MSHPRVIAVILNTNRRQDTLECLATLAQCTYPALDVIVLDNASEDGSVEAIGAAYPKTRVVPLAQNLGYAGNNNVGIRMALEAGADWVFVLNEDTLVAPDCLDHLVRAGEADPRVGVVGPMVYHHDEPSVIQSAGGILDERWRAVHLGQNQTANGAWTEPHPVMWISGCALLARRAMIEQIGLLDERFFYYWEETDWCMRGYRSGWQMLHVPQAHLWHKGVQRDYRPSVAVTYYNARNRLLFLTKHQAPLSVWGWTIVEMVRTLASMSLRPKWRTARAHRDAIVQAIFDYVRRRWGMRSVRSA